MPRACVLLVLDGLGDRSHAALGGLTPLQAAATPHLDAIAAAGANGLYHAGFPGQALPSENAHFAMFGASPEEFPGRGYLEALGMGLSPAPGEVCLLAHFCCAVVEDGCLRLFRDKPEKPAPEEAASLFAAVAAFEHQGVAVRLHRDKGLFGVVTMTGDVSPEVTDTNPMVDGLFLPEPEPMTGAGAAAARTARALRAYLLFARRMLAAHPVNAARAAAGLAPINTLVTQRAGMAGPLPRFGARFGLRPASVASGTLFRGIAKALGFDLLPARDTGDPGADLAARLETARAAVADYDFLHVHTKAPDEAAHTKDPLAKKAVIEALDAAVGRAAGPLLADPEVLFAVTADHSTPSSGPLIHGGEPVPLCLHGPGQRVDAVARFDEVSAATGCLGFVRGTQLPYLILNGLERARLVGIRDTPDPPACYPGPVRPFRVEES